jgi:hypothetical protein
MILNELGIDITIFRPMDYADARDNKVVCHNLACKGINFAPL